MIRHLGLTLQLFTVRERWTLLALSISFVLAGLLEMAGVALVVPFITLAGNADAITESPFLQSVYAVSGVEDRRAFLLLFGIGVLIVLAVGATAGAAATWVTQRFAWNTHARLSEQLLSTYIGQPYLYFVTKNTAELSKTLLGEVYSFVVGFLVPGLQLLARSVVVVMLLLLIVVVDSRLAGFVGLFLAAYAAIYLSARSRLLRIGKARMEANGARYKAAAEAFGGIKDLKVFGREHEFVKRFAAPSRAFSLHLAEYWALSQMPRFLLEVIAFGGLVTVVLVALGNGEDLSRLVAILILYGVAGMKLVPALQRVFQGLTSMRVNYPVVETLHRDLQLGEGAGSNAMSRGDARPLAFEREISLRSVCFSYPGAALPALEDVDLTIRRNTIVGLVGSTGSGKSTLVDVILGLLQPQEGEIRLDDRPFAPGLGREWRLLFGYVPQQIYLGDYSIAENIAFGLPPAEIDASAVQSAAATAGLADFIGSLPAGYATVVGERGVRLSGGQRQRIGIARALYHDPPILILDEATNALDRVTEDAVLTAIDALSSAKTVIVVAHRLTTIRNSDVIYVLEKGRIVGAGPYEQLLDRSPQFREFAQVGASS